MRKTAQSAFTLIELLVVIAIISVLATVVFVALDPAGRLLDARNARRTNDVQSILTALHECVVDNDGDLTGCGLSTSMAARQLSTAAAAAGCDDDGTACGTNAACLNLTTQLTPYFLDGEPPIDPSLASTSIETHYGVTVNANNIITVTACTVEGGVTVSVSR